MSAKVISIINYKGGVAKTTSAYNIAHGLSFLNNHKVLMIDLDPQCSLSTICMKALSRTLGKVRNVSNLKPEQTINSVIKDYLTTNENPNIDLKSLITKNFYTTQYKKRVLSSIDFIPATMYDESESNVNKGLDDLEIEIVRNYANKVSSLDLVTLFARFFTDTKVNEMYDFIIFDCPPANNIITQNALLVSDYYLIPTIMDDMSSNGINHLINVIDNSVYQNIYNENQRVIDRCESNSYLNFLKNRPEFLGIFETLRKTQVRYNGRRVMLSKYKKRVFKDVIYHHKGTADATAEGKSVFSVDFNVSDSKYAPYNTYGGIVLDILKKLGIKRVSKVSKSSWL